MTDTDLPSWVKAGQKVVCIDNSESPDTDGKWVQPALNTPYTIAYVNENYPDGKPHVVIAELKNFDFGHPLINVVMAGYRWTRFKPLVEDDAKVADEAAVKTDVEKHFKKLLAVDVPETVG